MTYCIADIHGEFGRFRRMLELIHFSKEDALYVLGDVIDRGPDGVEALEYIMKYENIRLLMGNHEWAFLTAMRTMTPMGAEKLIRLHDGEATYEALESRGEKKREEILTYLEGLPVFLDIEVDGRKFHLVHGFPGETTDERLHGRPERKRLLRPIPGKTVIVGHTPVQQLKNDFANMPFIWHGPGVLDIDCGCGYNYPERLLACLRLEDMHEFYV